MIRYGILVLLLLLPVRPAEAQVPGFSLSKQWTIQRIGEFHWKLTGAVEIERDDLKFYADEVDVYTDRHSLVASGNVVFTSSGSRIAADRAVFDTHTETGTFYNAAGTASLVDQVDRNMFGAQEPDAYFYGETIDKIGAQRYRITKGGFTTCVQPTPRWEITSSSVTINLDEYAILRNSVLKVKGVPVLYLPILYYPIQEDDRATGFLLPTYGSSTYRGQTLSNAFFWAISRSQDATFFHDWFSRTGQGQGAEYRYVLDEGSAGDARLYFLREHEAEFTSGGGSTVVPGRRSFELRGNARQRLPGNLRARGRADYFSNVTVKQTYHQNVFDWSQRTRTYGGNVTGSWGAHSMNATVDWREVFFGGETSTLYGSAPRISFNRAARRLVGPVYFSVGTEYARLLRADRDAGETVFDQGLDRFDLFPLLRVPLTRWQWLSVNSVLGWRATYYSESLDARRRQIEVPIWRRYFDMRSEIVGPVFTKIWDTPGSGYAERMKHVIEPTVSFDRVTPIEEREQIVELESMDYVIGGNTRVSYGVVNRFLARLRGQSGRGRAREFLTVTLNQSYYTQALASQYDLSYSTSFLGRSPSNFSPVRLGVRVSPTDRVDAALRLEYDPEIKGLQTIGANGSVATGAWLRASAGWSQRRITQNEFQSDNFLNASTTLRGWNGRVGGTYAFNYDLRRRSLLQQRMVGYYNAQCCGFGFEYQTFNFPQFDSRFPIASDRRFNFSVTLAGIGTFSNFFGAMGESGR